jgi:SEC-C motif
MADAVLVVAAQYVESRSERWTMMAFILVDDRHGDVCLVRCYWCFHTQNRGKARRERQLTYRRLLNCDAGQASSRMVSSMLPRALRAELGLFHSARRPYGAQQESHHRSLLLSRPRSGAGGSLSEARVKRGDRSVRGGEKELLEKLGRNDLCPCGSRRRFQEMLYAHRGV